MIGGHDAGGPDLGLGHRYLQLIGPTFMPPGGTKFKRRSMRPFLTVAKPGTGPAGD
jgi:hypothetical protein